MGSKKSSKSTSSVRLSPELRSSSLAANSGALSLYNQGTEGIYQGTGLAEQDPLIAQAQNEQLGLFGQDGDLRNLVNQQQAAYQNLLGAGDINNPLVQRQIADLANVVGENFGRTILPQINQGATAAGQFGSSRQGIAQGIAAGDAANAISRGATQALLGGQQLAMQAQQLAPQAIGMGLLPSQAFQDVGQQRTNLAQMQLADRIQQFNAPRQAELQNLTQFTQLLASNPLNAESTTTTKTKSGGGSLGQTLGGLASIGAGIATGNPALMAGGGSSLFGSLFGGGAPMMNSSGMSTARQSYANPFGGGMGF